MTTTKRRRGRSRKTGKHYFTQLHEDAILEYVETDDLQRKEELYITLIKPALNEMVDKICYTYKFTTLPNCDEKREECKIWLTTILDKFNQDNGSKAFSYFSVITKNWFIAQTKKHNTRRTKEIQYNDIPKSLEEQYLSDVNPYIPNREKKEFWEAFWIEIKDWGDMPMKNNEKRVYDAVVVLMENADDIDIFNKKAVYLYLRELTNLNTKQVVNQLNKLRIKYKIWKNVWDEGLL